MELLSWFREGVKEKTSWEWMELLLVPLFLAVGAFYLETRVESRQEKIASDRYEQEARIADERAKQETLDNYLVQMQGLLLENSLRESTEDSEVRSVARAITTTAMKELDGARNALLLDFLRESNLIALRTEDESKVIAILSRLNLSNANLRQVNLTGTSLSGASLIRADLRESILLYANLTDADLSRADLRAANLIDADLSEEQLKDSLLCKTKLPEGFSIDPNRDC
ncbi:MAG: pentapeptide repeat-containing protein [Cyanobacteria bacterium P01_D01_bin.36]